MIQGRSSSANLIWYTAHGIGRYTNIVYTKSVYTESRDIMKNITFSADENKIEIAREVARSEHKTLNDAFREWLDWYASRKVTRAEIEALFERLKYVNAGRKFTREEMNER